MTVLRELNIPHMGSVENAKLLEWRVTEGESFKEGDVLCEIETDKTATDVEASEAGVLVKHLAAPEDEFKVGDRIGWWVPPGTPQSAIEAALGQSGAEPADAVAPPSAPPESAKSANSGDGARYSPLVRRLAAEHGVDLTTVSGTGPGGRITGEDVLAAAGGASGSGEATIVPHSLRRKTIAQRMTAAGAIPTVTADMEIDLSALFARREALKADGNAPSILALFAYATVATLARHPRLNAHWRDDAMLQWPAVHLGVAVETDDGLVVPVIRDAAQHDAKGLTGAIAQLAERARAGDLKPADLEGGTFTLSNPGALGPVVRAEALLNVPQVALLGLPGIVREPRALTDGDGWRVEVRPILRASLTFDHRAFDGGPAIAFLNDLKAGLEAL